jgi:RNA polymerase sigma factor (sigma-70 family)
MNEDSKNNKKLIDRLKEGDDLAFEQIYITYHKSLYGMAVKWLKNRTLAKDAVQNVYLKLWDYRSELDAARADSLKPLLTTFLRNEILNTIRNKKRRIKDHIEFSWNRKKSSNTTE